MTEDRKLTDQSGKPLRPAATGTLSVTFHFNNSDPDAVRKIMRTLETHVFNDIRDYRQREPMIVWYRVKITDQSR
ncbi:MAG: hypothetical protein ABSF66_03430 [Terriglobales bacterium]|jgi:hypothetical protein